MLVILTGFIILILSVICLRLSSFKKALLVSSPVSLLMLVLLFKTGIYPATICVAVLNLTALVCVIINNDIIRKKQYIKDELEKTKKDYDQLLKNQDTVKEQNRGLERGLNELTSLYEATKEMNASRHFTELFEVFNEVLREHFKFGAGSLSLIKEKDEHEDKKEKEDISFNEAFFVLQPSGQILRPGKETQDTYINELIKTIEPGTKERFLDRLELQSLIPDISLKEDLKTLALLPIGLETSSPIVFTGENFLKDDFSKLLILSRQLGMEVQRVSLYEKVQELAITDGLTRLLVRRRFMERMQEELERSLSYNLKLSVLMLDIDHFKDYNDRYGHLVGDVVLRDTAAIIKNSLGDVDLACRYGGEEFCVILPETNKKGGLRVGERIRWAIENHSFKAYDEVTNVSISIGISTFPDDSVLMEELIDNADKALYQAKETGRNRVCDYAQLS